MLLIIYVPGLVNWRLKRAGSSLMRQLHTKWKWRLDTKRFLVYSSHLQIWNCITWNGGILSRKRFVSLVKFQTALKPWEGRNVLPEAWSRIVESTYEVYGYCKINIEAEKWKRTNKGKHQVSERNLEGVMEVGKEENPKEHERGRRCKTYQWRNW